MRIAIIAPPWLPVPPPAYGGTEAVVDVLARGLCAAGHDVLLFATGDSTCPVPTRWVLDRAAGTEAATPATEIRHVINAYDAALEWDADVIHDHTLSGPMYGRRFGIPVVTTNHGPFDGELRDLYRAIAADVPVIALSRDHAGPADHPIAAVIHHGVDVNAFPVGSGEGEYAAFLGRMNPDKGVHLAAAVARRAGMPLRIAAKMREPAERDYFDHQVRPLLGGDIEYLGELGGLDKLELLGHATCLLNPLQWSEPFGMVMVEALACGTPVVATPYGSVPELVIDGETGYVRPVEGLADAVVAAGQLDRNRCRADAEDRFSARRMVADHVRLYTEMVERRRTVVPMDAHPVHRSPALLARDAG